MESVLLLSGMVHPCGSGAFGYFETTADVSDLTKVGLLVNGLSQVILTQFRQIS